MFWLWPKKLIFTCNFWQNSERGNILGTNVHNWGCLVILLLKEKKKIKPANNVNGSDDKAFLNLCPAKQNMVGTETKRQKALCKMWASFVWKRGWTLTSLVICVQITICTKDVLSCLIHLPGWIDGWRYRAYYQLQQISMEDLRSQRVIN